MVVVILILASLAVAGFVMLTDTRKNDNFKRLVERDAGGDAVIVPDTADSGHGADAGADGGGGGDGGGGAD